MDCISNLESLLNGILTIIDDEKTVRERIDVLGIPAALAFEENRNTQLLYYISDSQSLIHNINKSWGNCIFLNRTLYHQTMKAVRDRQRDYKATASVISSLRSMQHKISSHELNTVIDLLQYVMKAIKTTVDKTCWVLHIPDDELSMYQTFL